jgi:hypothetical protein
MGVDLNVLPPADFDKVVLAVEKVRERLHRAAAVLEAAGIPYAVIGGNAVAAWVSQIDEAAIRNTRDVDILLRRSDLPGAVEAMEANGFIYRHAASVDMFLDGPGAKARDAVHVIFANEKIREEYVEPAADVEEYEYSKDRGFKHLNLEALVRMKLTSFRDKDRTHLRDFLEVGLIDASWPAKYRPELAERLQHLIDTPDG